MQQANTDKLISLNEADELACQENCEDELIDALDELSALVASAALPMKKRMRLFYGISHLRDHIHCETLAMAGEMTARKN